ALPVPIFQIFDALLVFAPLTVTPPVPTVNATPALWFKLTFDPPVSSTTDFAAAAAVNVTVRLLQITTSSAAVGTAAPLVPLQLVALQVLVAFQLPLFTA